MQVDPIKPTLKLPGTNRLKVKDDKLLSNFGFKFDMRCYFKDEQRAEAKKVFAMYDADGSGKLEVRPRGSHSLTSELNLRTFGTPRSRYNST